MRKHVLKRTCCVVWMALATAFWAVGGHAAPAPEAGSSRSDSTGRAPAPPDSIRLAGPVLVQGGRILSTRDVRARIPVDLRGGMLPRKRIEEGLAALGAQLVDAGLLESRLVFDADSTGRGVLTVEDGPVARWDGLSVPGTSRAPFRQRPQAGARFDADRLERALRAWVDAATDRGYPFAAARIESLAVHEGRVRAGVGLDAGPYCKVEEIAFPGRTATRESFLRRWVGFRAGMPYRESDWELARRRLEQVGLFTSAGAARVALRPEGGVRIELPVEEAKHNRIEGAIGYSGRARVVTGLADLELGNLLGTGRRIAVRWERLQAEQSRLRLEARDPRVGPFPLGLRLSLEQEVRDSTYTTALLELLGEVAVSRDFTGLAGVEYRRSVLGLEPAERDRRISSVFGGRWDTERPGEWTGGHLETTYRSGRTQVRPAGGGPSTSNRLDRAELLAERYAGTGGFIVRAALRAEAVARADSLPPSEVLRFGGASTIRGFADESFSARRDLTGQLEAGPAWPGTRAYLFLDAASWLPPERRSRGHDTLGFGVGLAQESSGRRVVIDLAIPRGGSIADGRLHVQAERRF